MEIINIHFRKSIYSCSVYFISYGIYIWGKFKKVNELIENRKKRKSSITNFSNDLGEIYQDKINNVQENNNNSFNSSSYFDSFKTQ